MGIVDTHDFEDDQFQPRDVMEQVQAHDRRMADARNVMALSNACYTTNFWKFVRGASWKDDTARTNNTDVEVNRMWGLIGGYLGALYPRAGRATVSADPVGRGDPEKAQLVAHRWLGARRIHHRVMGGIRQGLLYPGCGVKVGYVPGRGNPMDRVTIRVIPWWQLLLDADVTDIDDERFRGHVYYRPKVEVEREYGLEDLGGTARRDFLQSTAPADQKTGNSDPKKHRAESDSTAFVRVLEFINFVDTVASERDPNIVYKGRLEVYVLDQGELSEKPVWMGPTPLATADGQMSVHIMPLIFNSEASFPLRGISHASRILPQLVEMNNYRSFLGGGTRKDTRQYVARKNTFDAGDLTKLHEGIDGHTLFVDDDYQGRLDDAIVPIKNAPFSTNIDKYLAMVHEDLERASGQSAAARGITTKATAFEVQTLEKYSESDFGMHAAIKDEWLAGIVKLAIRAMIAAMQDEGDSDGAYEEQDVELAEVGALPVEDAGPDEGPEIELAQEEVSEDAEEDAEQQPFIEGQEGMEPSGGMDYEPVEIPDKTIVMVDRNKTIEVEVEDLDADFLVTFEEGAHTPMNDVALQQNLVALLGPYSELWGAVQKGGPGGALARAYMVAMHERFQLPRDLHPDELDMKADAEKAAGEPGEEEVLEEEGMPPEEGPPPGPPPEQGPPPGPPPGPPEGGDPMDAIRQMPPEQAIAALKELYGDDPEMMQVLDQLAALPPEEAAAALAKILPPAGGPPPEGA